MIEDVEELSPEVKRHTLCKVKQPLQPHVSLPGAEAAQHIASENSLLACGSGRKSRAIENLAAWILRTKGFKSNSWIQVRPRAKRDSTAIESCADYVNGRTRSRQDERVQRPSTEDRAYCFLRSLSR